MREHYLPFDRSEHRAARAREGNEEGVALRVDLVAAAGGERRSQEALLRRARKRGSQDPALPAERSPSARLGEE